ncbi:MAG: helix-turn-helix domain-containing protein [Gammaproteobacteria bacterium]
MPKPDYRRIAAQLNEHLARARLSSQDLARKAGVDRKTVDRLRAGQAVRDQTLAWIEQALGIALSAPVAADGAAPAAVGGYLKEAVIGYVGEYVAYRRSFDTAARIIASHLEIAWDEDGGLLRFSEAQDNRLASGRAYAYRFGGEVLIPPNLGVMHFVVRSDDGRVRLISTSMPREDAGTLIMKGFILTLNELQDIGYYPVTSPIFMARIGGAVSGETGVVNAGDPGYDWAREMLDGIEQRFLPASG